MAWRCKARATPRVTREPARPGLSTGGESLRRLWQSPSCLSIDRSFAIAWLRVDMKDRASFFLTTFQLLICRPCSTQRAFTWSCCVNDLESSTLLQAQTRLHSSPAKQEFVPTRNLGWLLENPYPTLRQRWGLWVLRQPLVQDSILEKACSPSGSEVFPPVSWAGTRNLRCFSVLSILQFLIKSTSARMALILSHPHLWHVKLLSGFGGLWGNTNLQACVKFLKSKNLICQLDLEHIFLKKL